MPHFASVLQSDEAINLYHPALCWADLNNRCSNRQGPAWPSPRLSPPGALGLPLVLPLACLAAAPGPGRPGLPRCHRGGLACPAGDNLWGAGGRAGLMPEDAGIRAAGISRPQKATAGPPLAPRRSVRFSSPITAGVRCYMQPC